MIDLSSDTATRPSEGMRAAMASADVGDEQKREDPTTNLLQESVAQMLGKPAALFMPSATMCNLAALRTHLRPGDGFLADARSHIILWEAGGYAAVAGAAPTLLHTETGVFSGEQVHKAVNTSGPNFPLSRLVCIENTHNAGGGTVWPLDELRDVTQAAKTHGLALHMDGARLLNAAAALNVSPDIITSGFDSVTLCLSKGLGCPAGALLAGSVDFIEAAWRSKQMLGGSMRQSGVLAAAGLYALKHHLPGLEADHVNARRLAQGLSELPRVRIELDRVQSNLVFLEIEGIPATKARRSLLDQGVRMSGDTKRLRAVTYRDISPQQIEQAIEAARLAWR